MEKATQTPTYPGAVMAAELRGPKLTVDDVRLAAKIVSGGLAGALLLLAGWYVLSLDGETTRSNSGLISRVLPVVVLLLSAAIASETKTLQTWISKTKSGLGKLENRLGKVLPTREAICNKRQMLRRVVDTAEDVLQVAARINSPDQFRTWSRLGELDEAVERLAELGEALKAATPKGSLPAAIEVHLREAELAYRDTLTPECISGAVVSYLKSYVGSETRSFWHRDLDVQAWGFFDLSLRFSCRSNLDWAMVNAWCVAGTKLFDPDYDETIETMTRRDKFLAWWNNPAEERPNSLPYDRILMHAPVVAYKAKAWRLEDTIQQYPISHTLFGIVESEGAPIEYVTKLWQDSIGPGGIGARVELKRIVNAARKIAR